MLARRLCVRAFAAPVATVASRRLSSTKTESHDDDRWLEAVFDEHTKEMTNEERYAAQKEREVLKKMMGKMRSHADEKVKVVEAKHADEIADLKKRLAQLEKK